MQVYYDTPAVRLTSESVVMTTFKTDGSVRATMVLRPSMERGVDVPMFPEENVISIPAFLEAVKSNKHKLDNNAAAIAALEKWIADRTPAMEGSSC